MLLPFCLSGIDWWWLLGMVTGWGLVDGWLFDSFSFSSLNLLSEIFLCMSSDRFVDDFFLGGLWFETSFPVVVVVCRCSSSDAEPESDSDMSSRLCSVGVMLGKWRSFTIFFSPSTREKEKSQKNWRCETLLIRSTFDVNNTKLLISFFVWHSTHFRINSETELSSFSHLNGSF